MLEFHARSACHMECEILYENVRNIDNIDKLHITYNTRLAKC